MADPSAAVAGSDGTSWLRVLLWVILILFALFYLAPLYVMIATSLEERGGDPHRQSLGPAGGAQLRCLGESLVIRLCRRRMHRHRPVLLQLGEDGRPRRPAVHHDRRAERLCADQMDVPWRQPDLRADPVRLLHPVSDRADPDGPHAGHPGYRLKHAGPRARPRRLRPVLHHALLSATSTPPSRPIWSRRPRSTAPGSSPSSGGSCCRTRCRSWS